MVTPPDRHAAKTLRTRPAWLPRWSLRLWLALAVIATCAVGGGSPRIDPLSLLYVRPVVTALLVALILVPGHADLARSRSPLLLLAAFALTITIQLLPLPPVV